MIEAYRVEEEAKRSKKEFIYAVIILLRNRGQRLIFNRMSYRE